MTAVTEFPDVSHYQAGLKLNGALACIAKATEGTGYVDPTYLGFRSQAAALAIPFSGYHWLNTADPAAQAHWYFDHANGAPCMWDAEADGATVAAILTATASLRKLGGHAWGAYLPHWWWQDHLGSPDLRPLTAAGLALVSSDYRTTPAGAGWVPYGGVTPAVWQFTDGKSFGGQAVDFNRYEGTPAQLAALFAGTVTPELEEDSMHRIRSGAPDFSIYLVPGFSAPSGKMAAYGLNSATNQAYDTAGVKLVQLPTGVTVGASGLYDIAPQPWPVGGVLAPHDHAIEATSTGPALPV